MYDMISITRRYQEQSVDMQELEHRYIAFVAHAWHKPSTAAIQSEELACLSFFTCGALSQCCCYTKAENLPLPSSGYMQCPF